MNLDNIINDLENLDSNQDKNNSKYQNFIKNNNNHKISYVNYINKSKNILYDKKNHLNKFISNNNISKKNYPNSSKDSKINKENEKTKTQVLRNKINFEQLNENQTENLRMKTPKNIKDLNINENNTTPVLFNASTNKKNVEENLEVNNIENNNLEQLIINTINTEEKKENNNQNKNAPNDIKENKEMDKKENIENIQIKNEKEEEFLLNPEEIKNKIIKSLEESQRLKKEIISQIIKNREYNEKFLLIKEKFYSELKLRNRLNEKTNDNKMKSIIHVNLRGKLNSNPYFAMKQIKSKESKIFYKIFYEHKNSPQYKALEAKRKLKEKMEHQKKVHSLLNLVRELVEKFENLSQIYKNDEKKKILFKSLLLRYGIREKEENKENNLMDKFNEIKKKLEEEKKTDLMKVKQKEIQNDLYKNTIKEEDDEERSSVSENPIFQRKWSLKNKLSWCSEDSLNKEKENFESNKSNNNEDGNNSLLSSGLERIKESLDEDLVKNDGNNNNNQDEEKKEDINDIKKDESNNHIANDKS